MVNILYTLREHYHISKNLKRSKKENGRLRGIVDWNDEIRRFLEARVGELYRREKIAEVRRVISLLPEMPPGQCNKICEGGP